MKKNSCPEKEILSLYFLNLLEEKERIKVEEHLKSCEICLKEYQIEKEIEKNLIYEIEMPEIEEVLLKKLKIYKSLNEVSIFFKFFKVFLTSAAIISIAYAFYLMALKIEFKNLSLFKSQEIKSILVLFSLYLKEIKSFFQSENLRLFYVLSGVVFFLANFFYGIKKYFLDRKFI